MRFVLTALLATAASAPALAQEVTIAARDGKFPTAAEAAHCVAYYRTEAKLRRPPNAPFEETLRGEAWKIYLKASARDADALIAEAEKEVGAALANSRNTWRDPYEEPCGVYEQVRLP